MARPELFHLGRLRALRGDALVTYPYGSTAYKQVERVFTVERNQGEETFLVADGQYTGTALTEQRIIGGDHIFVEIYQRYETVPGPELTGAMMSGEAQGEIARLTTQQLLANAADYVPDWKTLSYTDTPIDANRKQRTVTSLPSASSFPVLTEYDQDQETGALITTTYEVVEASTVTAPSFVVGQITQYRKIDKWRSLKIRTVFATPASYSEFRFAAHSFPSLLYAYAYNDACLASYNIREGFSSFTDCRIDISYGAYDSSIAGLQIKPNTFRISRFNASGVLNDAGTLTLTGTCTDTLTLDASTPTRTAYEALIGSFSLISGESVLWKAGRFRTTRLYYRML